MIKVKEIMTENVVTLSADDSLLKAKSIMTKKDIRHLPIINKKKHIVGLVTLHDILNAATSCLEKNTQDNKLSKVPVSRIMTREVRIISANESLKAAGLIMEQLKFGCVPVVHKKKLVGIITDTDFVGVAINLIEQMELHEDFDMEEENF